MQPGGAGMAELILIVRLAGRRVAVRAADVEAVVELEGLTPVPRAAPHVAGLSALRSRVLTVIDARAAMELGETERAELPCAIVVPSAGQPFALLVDSVEDVVEPAEPPTAVTAPVGQGWERVARGMIETDGELLLLVDPHALIAGPAAQAA
jgi:purine-binding chemotaxis protein CheW